MINNECRIEDQLTEEVRPKSFFTVRKIAIIGAVVLVLIGGSLTVVFRDKLFKTSDTETTVASSKDDVGADKLDADIVQAKENVTKLQKRLDDLKLDNAKPEDDIEKELVEILKNIKEADEKLVELKTQIIEAEKSNEENDKKQKLTTAIICLNDSKEKLLAEQKSLEANKAKLENDHQAAVIALNLKIGEKKTELKSIKIGDFADIVASKDALKKELDELTVQKNVTNTKFKAKLDVLEAEKTKLTGDLKGIEDELNKQKGLKTEKDNELNALKDKKNVCEKLKAEIEELEEKLKAKNSENGNLIVGKVVDKLKIVKRKKGNNSEGVSEIDEPSTPPTATPPENKLSSAVNMFIQTGAKMASNWWKDAAHRILLASDKFILGLKTDDVVEEKVFSSFEKLFEAYSDVREGTQVIEGISEDMFTKNESGKFILPVIDEDQTPSTKEYTTMDDLLAAIKANHKNIDYFKFRALNAQKVKEYNEKHPEVFTFTLDAKTQFNHDGLNPKFKSTDADGKKNYSLRFKNVEEYVKNRVILAKTLKDSINFNKDPKSLIQSEDKTLYQLTLKKQDGASDAINVTWDQFLKAVESGKHDDCEIDYSKIYSVDDEENNLLF